MLQKYVSSITGLLQRCLCLPDRGTRLADDANMGNKILIVDDTESVLSAMANYFQLLGYAVDCAGNKGEAERLLASEKYQVVIADLRLSGSAGTEGWRSSRACAGGRAASC